MAEEEKVKEYVRKTATGQSVVVKTHSRVNEGASAQALATPGRPPIAARMGQFPNGRSTPGVWLAPPDPTPAVPVDPPLSNPDEHGDFGKKLPDHLRAMLEPEFDSKTGKPLKKPEAVSPKTQKIIAAAAGIVLDGESLTLVP